MSNEVSIIQGDISVRELYKIRDAANEVVTSFAAVRAEGEAINRTLQSGQIREVSNAMQNLTQNSRQYQNVTDQLTAAERRLQQVERQLSIAQSEHGQQIANLSVQTRNLTAEQRRRAETEQRLAALSDAERQRLGNTLQIYNAVQARLNVLQNEYRNLAVAKQLGMNLTDAEKARYDQLQKQIQKYDATLKAVDASMGNHRRNVGNYTGGFNSLNNSVAQIAREMPAFTYSMQTGFLAISNNLPIFFDAVAQAKAANAAMAAEGKATVPVWKQVTSSILGWQVALSVGITLLTVYGQKVYEAVKQMFSAKKASDVLKESQEELNKQLASNASQTIVKYKELQDAWNNLTGSFKDKEKFIKDNTDKFHELGVEIKTTSDAEKLFAQGTESFIKVLMLRAEAAANAQLAIDTYKKAVIDQKKEEKDLGAGGIKNMINTFTEGAFGWRPFKAFAPQTSDAEFKAAEEYIKKENELLKKASDLQKSIGIKEYNKPEKTPGADKFTAEQKNRLMRLEAERDNELTINERKYNEGLITFLEYQKNIKNAEVKFNAEKIVYLKGNNAKEVLEVSKAQLALSKAITTYNEKTFEFEYNQLEENNKKKLTQSEKYLSEIERNQNTTESQRIEEQVNYYDNLYKNQSKYYDDLIELAKSKNQPFVKIERERYEELGKIQDARASKEKSRIDALIKDLEVASAIATSRSKLSFEEQKSVIISDKKLSNAEKEYRLNLLEIDNQIKANELQIDLLEKERKRYDLEVQAAKLKGESNPDAEQKVADKDAEIERLRNEIKRLNKQAINTISEKDQTVRDNIAEGIKNLGFNQLADAYTKTMQRLQGATADWKDYAVLAASAVLEAIGKVSEAQKEKTLSALNEQLKASQDISEQEVNFLQSRIDALNSLGDLTQEQINERTRLETEALAEKERQRQREKLIETQKAKAEQKAAANQALINGALAATQTLAKLGFPAGVIPAAIALAFGVAQSVAIMAKDPVPQYWKGRLNGPKEIADTQEFGRELITNNSGYVINQGSATGTKRTLLNEGDRVFTAGQTQKIIKEFGGIPKLGQNIFRKAALKSLNVPTVNIINQSQTNSINEERLAERIVSGFDRSLKKRSNPSIVREKGKIVKYDGNNVTMIVGSYDTEAANEKWL